MGQNFYFLQNNQIPNGVEQNRCCIGFSKIANLLKIWLVYRPFFGFCPFFSKVPNFWNLISLHFGFFGPKIPYYITLKKKIAGLIFFFYIFSNFTIFSKKHLKSSKKKRRKYSTHKKNITIFGKTLVQFWPIWHKKCYIICWHFSYWSLHDMMTSP